MNFQYLIYALVTNSLLCAASTGAVSVPVVVAALLSVPVGLYLDARQKILVPVQAAKFVFVAVMGIASAEYAFLGLGWFYAILDLLVLVTAIKLIAPKANRDYVQMMAMALLLILASSILTTDASFSLFFLMYVVLLCWSLMVFTVKTVTEHDLNPVRSAVATRQAHLPQASVRDVLEGRLFGVALIVVAFVVVFTIIFFAVFPRFGSGIIGGSLGQQRSSGLSDSVDFNTMGELKPDTSIALRIEILQGNWQVPAYIRGNILDEYKDRSWKATGSRHRLQSLEGGVILPMYVRQSDIDNTYANEVSYRILAEDLGVQTIPVLPNTFWLKHKTSELYTRDDGAIALSGRFRGAFGVEGRAFPASYQVFESANELKTISYAEITKTAANAKQQKQYSDLPNEVLPVVDLAITETLGTAFPRTATEALEALAAVEKFMLRNFAYTLDPPAGDDVLLSFWQQRKGHCEYFATMFALIARRIGFQARMVSGFAGGEKATVGDYYIFRNSDAHSWVEIWLGSYGWVAFDPTPPFQGTPHWWTQVLQFGSDAVDYYRYLWIQRVIAYDLSAQADIVESINFDFSQGRQRRSFALSDRQKWAAAVVGALIGFVLLWLWIRPSRADSEWQNLPYRNAVWTDRIRIAYVEFRYGKRQHNQTWESYILHNPELPDSVRDWLRAYLLRRFS